MLAPVLLVRGPEGLLRERALAGIMDLARQRDPATGKLVLEASTYARGQLSMALSPSLFDEPAVVVLASAQACTDDVIADVLAYLAAPDAQQCLVIEHAGGMRGKKMLDALTAAAAPILQCDEIKRDGDKAHFVTAELKAAGRRAQPDAVRSLIEAVGGDLRELAAAVAQLVSDTSGTISLGMVDRYYGGRVEATVFKVADAALAGDSSAAVALMRHAFATGVDPVPLVAALALKLRQLAKVSALRGSGITARDIGMQEWLVRKAQEDLRRWTPGGLAAAITAVAQADAEVKGAGRDPIYAVEKAVLTISSQVKRG